MLTLVSVITRDIISQYEDLLVEAGLEPSQIDFTTFSLYRLFSERLEISPNSVFVTLFGGILGISIFYEGLHEFYRAKEMPSGSVSADRIFREVNSSLAAYRTNHPGHQFNDVFCVVPFDDSTDFASVVAEATEMEPFRLRAVDFITGSSGVFCNGETLQGLSAALGAATRNL
jgi:type IV pilus assembly protein PilM